MAASDVLPAEGASRPPKPVLVFRVGVTGHRPKPEHQLPPKAPKEVETILRRTFESVDAALEDAHEKNADFYQANPHRVRLVSGMAEGVDQIAAHVRPSDWALDAVLPFTRGEYEKDFKKSAADESRSVLAEFESAVDKADTVVALPDIEDPEDRTRGYARLGNFVVRQIDLLVAVWDGKPATGVGGTADVVRQAMRLGVPVVWISTTAACAAHNFYPRMLTGFGRNGQPEAPAVDCTQGLLAVAVAAIVSVPKQALDGLKVMQYGAVEGSSPEERLRTFLDEQWPEPKWWAVAYDLLARRIQGKKLRLKLPAPRHDERKSEWDKFSDDVPAAGGLKERIRETLLDGVTGRRGASALRRSGHPPE